MSVTLDELKARLRVLHDFEDDLLIDLIAVAEEGVGSHIGKSLGDFEGPVPASIREAIIRLARYYYENPSSVGRYVTPYEAFALLRPYRYGGADAL